MKWHGKRAGFVISASLIAAVTISLIFVFFLKAELNGKPVIFTYHLESYSQQRYLTVNVDLSDGMNQSESVQVADALFDDCMGQYQHEVRARAREDTLLKTWKTIEAYVDYERHRRNDPNFVLFYEQLMKEYEREGNKLGARYLPSVDRLPFGVALHIVCASYCLVFLFYTVLHHVRSDQ